MRTKRPTRGNPESFASFFEHLLASRVEVVGDKRATLISDCQELLRRARTQPDGRPPEQLLYAQALLALLVQDLERIRGTELMRRLQGCVSDDDLSAIGETTWTPQKVQHYVEKSRYRDVFDKLRSRLGCIDGLRVAVLPSSQLNYVATIRAAFERSLRAVSPRWEPLNTFCGPRTGTLDDPVWDDISRQLKNYAQQAPLDFVVTIGTQASMLVATRFPDLRQIFLGVTRPIEARLIETFRGPRTREISGVAYCGEMGMCELVDRLEALFPQRKLTFVYMRNIPQDQHLANEAVTRNLPIHVLATPTFPRLAQLVDPEAVYFSWYTFDLMLEEAQDEALEILKRRIVVTTTLANVRSHRVPVAIAPRDHEIGEAGAAMLLQAHRSGESLKEVPIATRPLHVELHQDPKVFLALGLEVRTSKGRTTIVRAT